MPITTPSSPYDRGFDAVAGCTTGFPRPQVPTFAETRFLASARCWEAG